MRLWLDDIRPAPEGWFWVKTYDEAVGALSRNLVTHMSFDHDLADGHYRLFHLERTYGPNHPAVAAARATRERTGYAVALWMAERGIWPTVECRVHSFNPVGAKNICAVVDRYGPYDKPCEWHPAPIMDITQEQCDAFKQTTEAELDRAGEDALD